MTKAEFAAMVSEKLVYLDGATGSNLMQAGMPAGVCPEKWILEHEDILVALQKEYVDAGSNILYAPTFTANRIKLSEYGLEGELQSMTNRLVALSRKAAAGKAYVAGDLTMTGRQLFPMGDLDFEELIDVYKEQIAALEQAGVDLLVVETMMSLQECRAALIAAKETTALPIMVTMTFERDKRTLYGTDALTAAVVLSSLGADAVGINCSTGPAAMTELVRTMAEAVSIPIIAKPNAGLPYVDGEGKTAYDMDEEEFAQEMLLLRDAGASVLGGCCGTTPLYIKRLCQLAGSSRTTVSRKEGLRYLSSERKTHAFSTEDGFFVVGERINPTGKKKLQSELKEGSMELVKKFAEEQEANGAKVLDVNMGMGGVDEHALMLEALEAVASVTNLPLSIDSSHISIIEAALRRYPGRALVNSVSYESEKFEKLLPIVKKYGAMFILLPLSDAGLPENAAEKEEIISKIAERAYSLGMNREDIVVDGLVNTVGANKRAALETLKTIRYCRERGLATICGLSNISFGMPERSYVNTAFLTMAIQEGLTMAIANPSQEMLMACAFASDLLLDKPEADMQYISYAGLVKERREERERIQAEQYRSKDAAIHPDGQGETVKKSSTEQSGTTPILPDKMQRLKEAVLKGNREGIGTITKEALAEGYAPKELLDQVLLPAINIVGDYFDSGKYFLPQLIAGAETMKRSIEILEPLMLSDTAAADMPVVVIATVEGDIHDIGKNLVALMLKNYGFRVVDLGKDVPKEQIIEAAKEHHASIIALSALMTTTMKQMEAVIAYAREQKVTAKIMVGGAVITKDYAEEIGADGYSKDAADAVRVAEELLRGDGAGNS